MPDGFAAAAFAISTPRARTSVNASIGEITPAMAAAVISPTEWPATKENFVASKARKARRPAATMSGCALAVSLISSASAVVPRRTRSRPIASDQLRSRELFWESSSREESMAGVCDP